MTLLKHAFHFAYAVNGAISTGKYSDVNLHDVKTRIKDGSIIDYLENELNYDVYWDLKAKPEDRRELVEAIQRISNNRNHLEARIADDGNGLNLLLAFVIEVIQEPTYDF